MSATVHRKLATVVGALVGVGALCVGVFVVSDHVASSSAQSSTGTNSASSPSSSVTAPPTAGPTPPTTLPAIRPLTVRSITPASDAVGVATSSVITIRFSVRPTGAAPPVLSPAVDGHWVVVGDSWVFHPVAGYIPETTETVSVPSRTKASEEGRTVHLAASYKSTFTVQTGSILRLQQLLAELHYLPLTFTRTQAAAATTTVAAGRPAVVGGAALTAAILAPSPGLKTEPTVADEVSMSARAGRLTWAYPDIPASLAALWAKGKADELTKGAVMAFEADHGLAVDGVAGPQLWTTLLKAVAARQVDPRPYSYVQVTEDEPETLTVWQNGQNDVFSSLANTGIEGAETQQGTFPVYLRYASHEMKGTEPDGTTYDDPAIPWIAYFNGGDAIHGYPRASYGYPQSNGCVELPIPNAEVMWNSGEDWYGTLVTVT
jgi:peptidoglycan hydrolase-like protein with peptidoglycan-binding domain